MTGLRITQGEPLRQGAISRVDSVIEPTLPGPSKRKSERAPGAYFKEKISETHRYHGLQLPQLKTVFLFAAPPGPKLSDEDRAVELEINARAKRDRRR